MRKILLIGLILVFLVGCTPSVTITDFESCIAAGNPAMESYPMKCAANGEVFTEDIGEVIIGGCGTVTPGYNDECCANSYKDYPIPACVGEWKWLMPEGRCKFVCTTSETLEERAEKEATAEFIKCEREGEKRLVPCTRDSTCSTEELRTRCEEIIIPNCPTENFCKAGVCVYNCII